MINTILAYDNQDIDLGDFFEKCALMTMNSINSNFNVTEINSRCLNELTIQIKTEIINTKPFLFISFTHGSEIELLKGGTTPFISDTLNSSCLRNSFAYCFACYSGNKLGALLVENGAKTFVGYNGELKIQKFFGAFEYFIVCATSGIVSFLLGESINNAVDKMKEKYTECVDLFYQKDMVIASWFMEHRDAIVLLGDSKLSMFDLYNN